MRPFFSSSATMHLALFFRSWAMRQVSHCLSRCLHQSVSQPRIDVLGADGGIRGTAKYTEPVQDCLHSALTTMDSVCVCRFDAIESFVIDFFGNFDSVAQRDTDRIYARYVPAGASSGSSDHTELCGCSALDEDIICQVEEYQCRSFLESLQQATIGNGLALAFFRGNKQQGHCHRIKTGKKQFWSSLGQQLL